LRGGGTLGFGRFGRGDERIVKVPVRGRGAELIGLVVDSRFASEVLIEELGVERFGRGGERIVKVPVRGRSADLAVGGGEFG
jgi:hypothetical protein